MKWIDFVDRSEAIRAVFRENVPCLDGVRLHEIEFHQDGPTIFLRFDLNDYPNNPPGKWVQSKHNTVQIKLALDVISQIVLEGWSKNNIGDISICSADGKGFTVKFISPNNKLSAVCEFVRLDGISAYHDGAKK